MKHTQAHTNPEQPNLLAYFLSNADAYALTLMIPLLNISTTLFNQINLETL